MIRHQNLGGSGGLAHYLLEHGELVRGDRGIFVHSTLDVPTGEITSIASRKCSGAKTANGSALPVTIVDVAAIFPNAGIRKRLPQRPPPRCFWNFVAGACRGRQRPEDWTDSQQQPHILPHRA